MIFRTECAWCGAFINETECSENLANMAMGNNSGAVISHGMCETCRMRLENDEFPKKGGEPHVGLD